MRSGLVFGLALAVRPRLRLTVQHSEGRAHGSGGSWPTASLPARIVVRMVVGPRLVRRFASVGLSAWELACHALPITVFAAQSLFALSVSARYKPPQTVVSGTQRARWRQSARSTPGPWSPADTSASWPVVLYCSRYSMSIVYMVDVPGPSAPSRSDDGYAVSQIPIEFSEARLTESQLAAEINRESSQPLADGLDPSRPDGGYAVSRIPIEFTEARLDESQLAAAIKREASQPLAEGIHAPRPDEAPGPSRPNEAPGVPPPDQGTGGYDRMAAAQDDLRVLVNTLNDVAQQLVVLSYTLQQQLVAERDRLDLEEKAALEEQVDLAARIAPEANQLGDTARELVTRGQDQAPDLAFSATAQMAMIRNEVKRARKRYSLNNAWKKIWEMLEELPNDY